MTYRPDNKRCWLFGTAQSVRVVWYDIWCTMREDLYRSAVFVLASRPCFQEAQFCSSLKPSKSCILKQVSVCVCACADERTSMVCLRTVYVPVFCMQYECIWDQQQCKNELKQCTSFMLPFPQLIIVTGGYKWLLLKWGVWVLECNSGMGIAYYNHSWGSISDLMRLYPSSLTEAIWLH